MSESPNPAEGRPAGSRSYGEASTAVRPAVPNEFAGPGGPDAQSGTSGGPGDSLSRALTGASRSFARFGAALGNVAQAQGRPAGRPGDGQAPIARVRKARLRVARVDPWSVMKISFVLSLAIGIVTMVGTAVVWAVLNSLGVFASLNKSVGSLTSENSGTGTTSFNLQTFLSFGHVEGYMVIIAIVDIVLVTALATLGAYLYNLAAGFAGGVEVTLAEDQ